MAAIAALVRISASIEAADIAAKMFDPQRKANFTEPNARDLLEAFNQAQTWVQRAGGAGAEKLAREVEAAQILVAALRQTTEGQWSTAVASVERLLREEADTLLVRLLSNGKPFEAPSPSSASGSDAPGGTEKPK